MSHNDQPCRHEQQPPIDATPAFTPLRLRPGASYPELPQAPAFIRAVEGMSLTLWPPVRVVTKDGAWSLEVATPPGDTPLASWLEHLPPGQRRWHTTRVGFLVATFLDQWHDALAAAGLAPSSPPLHAGHLRVDPATETFWIDLHALWPLLDYASAEQHRARSMILNHLTAEDILGISPERIQAVDHTPDAAIAWTVGIVLHSLLNPELWQRAQVESALHQITTMLRAPWPQEAPQHPHHPTLQALVDRALSNTPHTRPSRREIQATLLEILGAQDPPWLHLPLDGVLDWLRAQTHPNSVADLGLLFTLRPDLALSPIVQRHVEDHLADHLLTPLLPNSRTPLTTIHITLLKSLPGLIPELINLLQHPRTRDRLTLIDILGAYRSASAVGALMELINSTNHEEAWAAREAIARTPQLPIAWDTQHLRLIPCSVAWEQMTPHEGNEDLRTCTKCQHPVVRAHSLDALHQIAATGACTAFSPQDTLTLNINDELVYLLKTGQSFTLGSDPGDDLRSPDLPPRAAILHVHQKQLRLTPLQRHPNLPQHPVTLVWGNDLPDATRELRIGQLVLSAQPHGFALNRTPEQPNRLRFPMAGSPIPRPLPTDAPQCPTLPDAPKATPPDTNDPNA